MGLWSTKKAIEDGWSEYFGQNLYHVFGGLGTFRNLKAIGQGNIAQG